MAAKRNLCDRSEPSEIKAFGIGDQESRIRKVVLDSYGLKDLVVEPAIQEAYCGGVAGKDFGGESIHVIYRYSHRFTLLFTSWMVLPQGSLRTIRFSPGILMGHFSMNFAPFDTRNSASLSGSSLFNAICNCRW